MAVARSFRRIGRFNTLTVLIIFAVMSIALGQWVNSSRKQYRAIVAVRELGGEVGYSCKFRGGRNATGPCTWRFSKWIGHDFFCYPYAAICGPTYPGPSDPLLSEIGKLTKLKRLSIIWGLDVTDEGIAHLTNLKGLEHLDLHTPSVTDQGLRYLKALSSLRELTLYDTSGTKACIVELKQALPMCEITIVDLNAGS